MEKYKYSYEGMSLSQYCTENGISINAIRSKMYRMKQKEEYKYLSDQEIIKIAIESSHSTIKYTYKGIPLSQYCLEHNINIDTIYLRIRYLKKKDKTLTNDQLVTLSLENFKNQKFKYFYKGMPLKEYCKENNLNYPKYHGKNSKTLLDEIADSQKQNNTLSNPNIKEALETLSEENLYFTILRYQEEYSIEELASHFHMTVKEVKEKEIEILSLLKDNTKIKVMQKRRQSNAI